jgi:RNA polymerase sigma-70 factor, ECF subfamily
MVDPSLSGHDIDATQRSAGPDVSTPVSSELWVSDVEPRVSLLGGPRPSPVQAGRASAHSSDVLVQAYDAYQRDIHGFLRAATRDPDVAEDLTQETFIRLLKEVQAGRTPDNIRAWLYTVATNLVTSRGRRMAVAERFKAVLAIRGSADSPEQETVRNERQDIVQRALAKLPTDDRTALLLSAHGFAGRDIAAVLGRSDGATRTLLTRARIRLREYVLELDPDMGQKL